MSDFGYHILGFGAFTRPPVDTSAIILCAGGYATVNEIDRLLSTSQASATDFGDLNAGRRGLRGTGNNTKALFGGGYISADSDQIDRGNIQSTGNAVDWANLTVARNDLSGSCANDTISMFCGGYTSSYQNVIDKNLFASQANSVDYGNLVVSGTGGQTGGGSSTRAICRSGGNGGSGALESIDYKAFSSSSDCSDFGDMGVTADYPTGFSSSTYYFMASGWLTGSTYRDDIRKVNIASTGSGSDWGDVTSGGAYHGSGASSKVRGFIFGGNKGSNTNDIDYVSLTSASNSADWGDLQSAKQAMAGASSNDGAKA